MPEVTFHALRHTHASQLIDAGVDIVTISKRLGHAKPNITLRTYAHLFRKDDGKAAAAINAAFKPIVGKKLDPIRWHSGPSFTMCSFRGILQSIENVTKEGWPSGLRHRS
jgi:integrase-like protein